MQALKRLSVVPLGCVRQWTGSSLNNLRQPTFGVLTRKFCVKDKNNDKNNKIQGKNTNKVSGDVPDEFYDEDKEADAEFLDLVNIEGAGGDYKRITLLQNNLTWKKLAEDSNKLIDIGKNVNETDQEEEDDSIELSSKELNEDLNKEELVKVNEVFIAPDVGEHLKGFETDTTFIPSAMLNYTLPWTKRSTDNSEIHNFLPDTAREKFMHDKQGLRSCPGKRQKRGKQFKLECHIFDLSELHHLDVLTLRRFLSDDGEILGRKASGLCSKCQRQVAKTIKKARHFGILPHIGEYTIGNARPLHGEKDMHDPLAKQKELFKSKTII